jgi:hypothetical protein
MPRNFGKRLSRSMISRAPNQTGRFGIMRLTANRVESIRRIGFYFRRIPAILIQVIGESPLNLHQTIPRDNTPQAVGQNVPAIISRAGNVEHSADHSPSNGHSPDLGRDRPWPSRYCARVARIWLVGGDCARPTRRQLHLAIPRLPAPAQVRPASQRHCAEQPAHRRSQA